MIVSSNTRDRGRIYIKCTDCRRRWNVSAAEPPDKSIYICPQCRAKYKRILKEEE